MRAALVHEPWVELSKMRIGVQDGIVHLDGEVEPYSEKERVARWVSSIDRGVGVESSLTCRFDERTMRGRYDDGMTRVK